MPLIEQEPQVAWRWYGQVLGVAALAAAATVAGLYAGFFADVNHTTPGLWWAAVAFSSVLTAIAITGGYFAGRQWSPLWICIGWLIPFAACYACLAYPRGIGGGADCERTFALIFVVLPALGAVSTLAGILMRTRRQWAYALLALPFLSGAIAAIWQFWKVLD